MPSVAAASAMPCSSRLSSLVKMHALLRSVLPANSRLGLPPPVQARGAPARRCSRRSNPCGSRCRWRSAASWLHRRPAHHRQGRTKPMETAERLGERDLQHGELAAVSFVPADELGLASSSVTALTTRRPPRGKASQAVSRTPARLAPPPTNTASGRGKPASASGAVPSTMVRSGTPSLAALRAMRAARSLFASIAIARFCGWRSIHSMPIEPEPAPMSQSISARRGASAASVAARMSRFVICPSCSNISSGKPRRQAARSRRRAPPRLRWRPCSRDRWARARRRRRVRS